MDLETLHISQLYECVICCGIFILLIAEFLAGYNQLWGHIMKIRVKEQEEELKWVRSSGQSSPEVDEMEKSAQSSLRREMSEAKHSEGEAPPPMAEEESKENNSVLQVH